MSRIVKHSLLVTCAGGGAGTSAADQTMELGEPALVYAIKLDFSAGMPATADTTITDDYAAGVQSNVLVQANSATDKLYYPRAVASKSADGSASTLSEVVPLAERLRIQVAQGNPGETIQVDVYVMHSGT